MRRRSAAATRSRNPQLDGFDADPLLIAGRWATLLIDGQGDAQRFDADLTPAGGVFLGEFRFFRNGRLFELQFNDGIWDGTRLRFSAATPVGDARPVIFWEALLLPPDESGDRPARLLLFSDLIGGAAQGVEYVRLSSLPADLR